MVGPKFGILHQSSITSSKFYSINILLDRKELQTYNYTRRLKFEESCSF